MESNSNGMEAEIMEPTKLSYGEQAMGIDFSSDEIGDDAVIKTYAANLINYIVELRGEPGYAGHYRDTRHFLTTNAISSIQHGARTAIAALGLGLSGKEA